MRRVELPFDPQRNIRKSDLRLAKGEISSRNYVYVHLARDITVCFPNERAAMDISQPVIDQVVQETEQAADHIGMDLDVSRMLDKAAALKQLLPGLNPQIFANAQFLDTPILEYVRQCQIEASVRAQKDRVNSIPYPRWRRSAGWGLTDFANFHILTQGTSLALELSAADIEDGIQLFQRLVKTPDPFAGRQEYVKTALEVSAALKTIDPSIELPVEPSFWKEVRTLLTQTRNDRLDWDWYGGKRARKEVLKTNLLPYMRQARQATVLSRT